MMSALANNGVFELEIIRKYSGGAPSDLLGFRQLRNIDILYTLDSASLLVKLKPRIFQRLLPFE
jgi:hypothetical protein